MYLRYNLIKKLDDKNRQDVLAVCKKIKDKAFIIGWDEVDSPAETDLLIAIGGDGTMLYGMGLSALYAKPVFGFNLGKVGYLSEGDPKFVEDTLDRINTLRVKEEERILIEEKTTLSTAINDFVIQPEFSMHTLKYEFQIDGVNTGSHHANGMLISTPTGSTAYSLSVGGAILAPSAELIQLAPIAGMSMTSRSIVVPSQSSITVRVVQRKGRVILVADGRVIKTYETDEEMCLTFGGAKKKATLLHLNDWNFFTVLQDKLHWNERI